MMRRAVRLVIIIHGIAAAPAFCEEQRGAVQPESDIVVVAPRRDDLLDTIEPATIKSFGKLTIGELIDRLQARYGSAPLSLLVNGKRLASYDAISALPPEALSHIELLSGKGGLKQGYDGTTNVLNLVLRSRFDFISLEGSLTKPTQAGGAAEQIAGRYAHIRAERRFNAGIEYSRDGHLREGDRLPSNKIASSYATARYLDLIPRQERSSITAGYSAPIGAASIDLSMLAQIAGGRALAGIVEAPATKSATQATQLTSSRSVTAGATIGVPWRGLYWSLQGNATASTSRSAYRYDPLGADALVLAAGQTAPGLGTDTMTTSTGVDLTTSANGAVFALPAGSVTIDLRASLRSGNLKSSVGDTTPQSTIHHYLSDGLSGSVTLPLIRKGAGGAGKMGDLSLTQRAEIISTKHIGSGWGWTTAVNWSPVSGVQLLYTHQAVPSLPSATQLYNPETVRTGVLLYDDRVGRVVPVNILEGGLEEARRTSQTSNALTASVQHPAGAVQVGGTLEIGTQRTTNPLISLSSPTGAAEILFPSLFLRGDNGTLLTFDARAFYGDVEATRHVTMNLHASGTANPQDPSARSAFSWDTSISYTYTVLDTISLSQARSIDLFRNPLNLTGASQPRHTISAQWSIAMSRYGINGAIDWRGASHVRPLDVERDGDAHIKSLVLLNIEAFAVLSQSGADDNPSSLRINVGVTNILNMRPTVTGVAGFDSRLQSVLLDPLGRTIKLTIRKAF